MNRLITTAVTAAASVLAVTFTSVFSVGGSGEPESTTHKGAGAITPVSLLSEEVEVTEFCVSDLTDGLPVAEAVAEFSNTAVRVELSDTCPREGAIVVTQSDDKPHYAAAGTFLRNHLTHITVYGHELSEEQARIALIHELGHALGLDHNDRHSAMNTDIVYELDGLTELDRDVLEELYR